MISVTLGQANLSTSPLLGISQWEKIERRLFWTKTIRNTLKHRFTGRLDTMNPNIATSDSSLCCQGHFRSWKVTSSFSVINFDNDKIKPWKHLRCVEDDDTDRLICSMTLSDQVMTLTWGQIFKHDLWLYYSSFDASWQEKHDAGTTLMIVMYLLSQKLLPENFFFEKRLFSVFALLRSNCWFWIKPEDMLAKERQKSYPMRFSVAL